MQRFIVQFFVIALLTCLQAAASENTTSHLDFFTTPNMVMAKINPNGETVVALTLVDEKQQLIAINARTNIHTELIDLKNLYKGKSSITSLVWLDNYHIAAQLEENKKGVEELLNTQKSRRLIIIKLSDKSTLSKIYTVKTKGWLVHALPEKKNEFLYAKSGIYSKVYSIKISKLNEEGKKLGKLSRVDGGQFKKSNEIAEINGFATRWFLSKEGTPKAALHYGQEQQLQLSIINTEASAETLHSWPKEDKDKSNSLAKKLVPIAMASKENVFYCLDINELHARSIYKVDFRTGQEELVYESSLYKIVDVELTENAEKISSIKAVNNGRIETIFVENSEKSPDSLAFKNKHFEIEISKSLDESKAITYTESHTDPGSFFLKQQSKSKATLLGKKFPQLSEKLNSQLFESSLNVAGIEIPYLLSVPKQNNKSVPLIVMPHGGPIGPYDNPYYNPIVQYFNSNGFAVLRVNFRGSGGYSHELKESGKKQWGKLMLEDIHQATLHVIQRNDLQQQHVCIFGMSYGGYAAMMLGIKYPNTYKCAASWAGVSDINLYLNGSKQTEKQKIWVKEHIGDSALEYSSFMDESPVFNVKSMKTPLLLAHGKEDSVVDIEHAYRMKAMLDKHKKPYQWYLDDEASHSFGELKNRKAFFDYLLDFIQKHIH